MKTIEGQESSPAKEAIFVVVSPPRTGTTSMCKMAELCGFKPMHVLRGSLIGAIDKGYNFFSDTPFYIPEFLCGVMESLDREINFIYCHREFAEWKESMKLLRAIWKPERLKNKLGTLNDLCYGRMESDSFFEVHYHNVQKISEAYGVRLLDYRFGDGWKPFCDFVGKTQPDAEVPHLNNKTAKPYEYQSKPE